MSLSDLGPPTSSAGSVLPIVRYGLQCNDHAWRVRRFHLVESLGEPYRGEVEAICEDADLEACELVGTELVLTIARDQSERPVSGVVLEVESRDGQGEHARVVLRFGPTVALLGRGPASRVFQGKTATEIVGDLVGPTFEARDRTLELGSVARV